jgi:hypothetical protein
MVSQQRNAAQTTNIGQVQGNVRRVRLAAYRVLFSSLFVSTPAKFPCNYAGVSDILLKHGVPCQTTDSGTQGYGTAAGFDVAQLRPTPVRKPPQRRKSARKPGNYIV